MPRIDHASRRRRIVAESLRLFATRGYSKVNFGMIAQASGVARTILYNYFRDKRAIFNEAIDLVTGRIRATCEECETVAAGAEEKLRRVCLTVFSVLFDNRDYICVIADVLSNYRRRGSVPVEKVRAHTEGLVRFFERIVSAGVASGEFRSDMDPRVAAGVLYSQYEALALRIAVTGGADLSASVSAMDGLLRSLRAGGPAS